MIRIRTVNGTKAQVKVKDKMSCDEGRRIYDTGHTLNSTDRPILQPEPEQQHSRHQRKLLPRSTQSHPLSIYKNIYIYIYINKYITITDAHSSKHNFIAKQQPTTTKNIFTKKQSSYRENTVYYKHTLKNNKRIN